MFSDAELPEPELILEIENPVDMVEIKGLDKIVFNDRYTNIKLIRTYTYNLLKKAAQELPQGINFVVYEAYRPMSSQIKLWDTVVAAKKQEYPELATDSEEFIAICDIFAANPYRQGSGHQSGAAVDISLIDDKGKELDMGGEVRGFDKTAEFDSPFISEEARNNRELLRASLSKVGLVNYPSEWWHYSFGDRLWAKLTGSKLAIFGKLEI